MARSQVFSYKPLQPRIDRTRTQNEWNGEQKQPSRGVGQSVLNCTLKLKQHDMLNQNEKCKMDIEMKKKIVEDYEKQPFRR